MKRKILSLALSLFFILPIAAACGNGDPTSPAGSNFDPSQTINLVTRENGSGTRGAFVEIAGIEDAVGNDALYQEAVVQNTTNGVLSTVANNEYGIGYISVSALNEMVKAVNVNGAAPTADAIKSGEYAISRPFNIAYRDGTLSEAAKDFVNFILSAEGQAIVAGSDLIEALESAAPYEAAGVTGDIMVGGSTSVTPVMEVLAEEYMAINDGSFVEIQSTGSTAGMTGAMEGNIDIGMASRELSPDEAAALTHKAIGIDGMAVIVHSSNPVTDLSMDQIRSIYLGEITTWNELE